MRKENFNVDDVKESLPEFGKALLKSGWHACGNYVEVRAPQWYGNKKIRWEYLHRIMYCYYHCLPKIPNGWVVHHIDENRLNNSKENLMLLPACEHSRHHNLGCVKSEYTRALMSKNRKGLPVSDEARAKMSLAQRGKKRSEETKKKLSEALKGKGGKRILVDSLGQSFDTAQAVAELLGVTRQAVSYAALHNSTCGGHTMHYV